MTSYESWGTYELPGGGGGGGTGIDIGRWTGQEIEAGEAVSHRGGSFQALVNIPAPSPEPFTLAGVLDSNYVARSYGPVLVDSIPSSASVTANYPPSLRLSTNLVQYQLVGSGGTFAYEEGVTDSGGGGTSSAGLNGTGLIGFSGANWLGFSANARLNWNDSINFGADPDISTMTPVAILSEISTVKLFFKGSTGVSNTVVGISLQDRITGAVTHVVQAVDLSAASTDVIVDVGIPSYTAANDFNFYISFRCTVAPPAAVNVPFTYTVV